MRRTFQTAAARWEGVGPYYAMFPTSFADKVIQKYTSAGDTIFDPFAGRGTTLFSAVTHARYAYGVEINPVGYVYTKTKLGPASRTSVERRITEISRLASQYFDEANALPVFFQRCFCASVRRFLLAARGNLDWRRSSVDCTAMAHILVYLHGKRGAALSNQLRQAKAMSPGYAVRWWRERGLSPPRIEPACFLIDRLDWRYKNGVPTVEWGQIYMGDSSRVIPRLFGLVSRGLLPRPKMLLTSPPYCAITNYHYDQWIRLWVLGGEPNALLSGNGRGGKFEGRQGYEQLLRSVFEQSARLLARGATVYVRTDRRSFTLEVTKQVLKDVFPRKSLRVISAPSPGTTQTGLFGADPRVGEMDLVLS